MDNIMQCCSSREEQHDMILSRLSYRRCPAIAFSSPNHTVVHVEMIFCSNQEGRFRDPLHDEWRDRKDEQEKNQHCRKLYPNSTRDEYVLFLLDIIIVHCRLFFFSKIDARLQKRITLVPENLQTFENRLQRMVRRPIETRNPMVRTPIV